MIAHFLIPFAHNAPVFREQRGQILCGGYDVSAHFLLLTLSSLSIASACSGV
jgi:hypothetical protein